MSGFIYFITMEPDKYVKIGWAMRSPHNRLRELQTGCPDALRLMAYAPGSRDEERRLHETFAELHYRGEWFFNQHKLYDLITYLSDNHPRETNEGATRQRFEDGIWDAVISGFEHPDMPDDYVRAYRLSGDGLMWQHMHPEVLDNYPSVVRELFA